MRITQGRGPGGSEGGGEQMCQYTLDSTIELTCE